MGFFIDIMDGDVSDSIIKALQSCPAKSIVDMVSKKQLRPVGYDKGVFTSKSLVIWDLDVYSSATGVPIGNFFFPPDYYPSYTPYDRAIIASLNQLSVMQLSWLKNFLLGYFPNSLIASEDLRPSKKLISVFSRMPGGTFSAIKEGGDIPSPPYKRYIRDITPALLEYKKKHFSTRTVFHSDYLADLSTFAGASLHWVCSMKAPLFCNNQIGDLIFDHYCLCQPYQQEVIYHLLKSILQKKQEEIMAILSGGDFDHE